jgi:hypothetical protein
LGADLYIESIFDENNKKYEAQFSEAAIKRNNATTEEEREKYHKKVSVLYDKMYEKGYFRDSYNNSSLFWKLDLSWWNDLGNYIDGKSNMHPENIKKFLELIKSRKHHLIANLQNVEEDEMNYFFSKYDAFCKFLEEAIEFNQPIYCSV